MEFRIQKAEIIEMLNNAYGFCKEEIIGMEVKNNSIKIFSISSNNYFNQISNKVEIIQEGEGFFDINIFLKIIKSLPEDLIIIKKEENIMKISSGKCLFSIRVKNPYNYTLKIDPEIIMNFDTNNIIDAISKTNFVPDKNNFILTYIFIKNNDISFIGANPCVLGIYTFNESNLNNNSELELCILQEDFKGIYNVLKRNNEHNLTMGIDYKNDLIIFSINNITMVVKNNPPKINKINEFKNKFIIDNSIKLEMDKEALFSGIKQLTPLIEEDTFNKKLLFKIDEGNFSISDITGEGIVVLLENIELENQAICVNSKYIYEILKNNKAEKVTIEFSADDNTRPIMVCCHDEFSEYIVAPIRI